MVLRVACVQVTVGGAALQEHNHLTQPEESARRSLF
jgi:hypothetical protein